MKSISNELVCVNILILGYGQTGRALAQQLVQQKHHITVVSRHTPEQLDAGVTHLCQDIRQLQLDQNHLFDWVYVILAPSQRGIAFYQDAFVDTIRPITNALHNHPIQKIVFVSSTHVYGENQGQIVDDSTVPQAQDAMGKCLVAAEQLWSAYWAEKLIILRPSGLYQANSLYMVKQAEAATKIDVKHWTNRIHRQDLVGFLSYLLEIKQPKSSYILSDQQPEIQYNLWHAIRQQQGLSALMITEDLPQTGKQLHAQNLQNSGYQLQYPTWKQGYSFGQIEVD